ncbi:MAG: hypothetical protein JWR26_1630 [Pedosphaera sp.]|nr:hypothetical protein [Pedosphaera sp.]
MANEIHFTRKVWVAPSDLFKTSSAEAVGEMLERQFDCDVWVLSEGSALAFSPTGLLVNHGLPIDYPAFVEITKPLFQFVNMFIATDDTGTDLHIPDNRFYTRMLLKPEEPNLRYCSYIESDLTALEPFAFRAYSKHSMTPESRIKLRRYLEKWHEKYSQGSIYGDRLDCGAIEYSEYCRAGTPTSYMEDGFEVRWSKYMPSTWPWVELYLDMRKNMDRRQRLSIRFFNPTDDLKVSVTRGTPIV